MISPVLKRTGPTLSGTREEVRRNTGEWRLLLSVGTWRNHDDPRLFGFTFRSGGWNREMTAQGWCMYRLRIGFYFERTFTVEYTDRRYKK